MPEWELPLIKPEGTVINAVIQGACASTANASSFLQVTLSKLLRPSFPQNPIFACRSTSDRDLTTSGERPDFTSTISPFYRLIGQCLAGRIVSTVFPEDPPQAQPFSRADSPLLRKRRACSQFVASLWPSATNPISDLRASRSGENVELCPARAS